MAAKKNTTTHKVRLHDKNFVISEKISRMTARLIAGEPVTYNKLTHLPILLTVFARGGELVTFLNEVEICRSTFYEEWLPKFPELRRTYEVAKQLAHDYWCALKPLDLSSIEGQNFNLKLWTVIMRNRFGYTDSRKIKLPGLKNATTMNDKINCLISYIGDGGLTAHEAQQLSNVVLTAVKVNEATVLEDRLKALEDKAGVA